MDIAAWLRELGLERYEQAFRENEIDAEILPKLDADDLKDIGVTAVGHRRKLLEATAALAEPASAPQAEPSAPAEAAPRARPVEAERRQLTVLFCDLVGSTELSSRLDPEDMGAVIRRYQECCSEVVRRWDGHVAKYMGDGVLVYFGYPQAHEDDAERAVRAGLDLAKGVAQLAVSDGAPLAARVGIATGLVMVGDLIGEGAAQEQAVVGETPNLAARLQGLTGPGSVVIAEGTQRLLGGLFEYADLGGHDLKGFAEPIQAWRVLGESRAESRFEALHGEHLTVLVGREHEIGLLVDRWERAKEGEGQVVLLSGEPGIGKSRIVQALRARLADQPHTPLSHYCSPYHTNSALYPVISLLERAAGFARDDGAEARLDKLEALLARGTEALGEAVPLVAALLEIETGQRYAPLALSPQRQKQRTLEVLIDQVAGLAATQPVFAVYEDAHWIDPTTLEALGLLIQRVQRLPALVLITHRPEFSPPWSGHAHVMQLSFSRLTRRHGQELVEEVTGGKALPAEVLDQIVAKTDGVPLFVEELTKAVLESGLLEDTGERYALTGPLPPLAIPASLQDSLMARLDRLAPFKEVAQLAAMLGRVFSRDLLGAVSPRDWGALEPALSRLVEAGLIYRRGFGAGESYEFKHALVQDTAYQSLLKSTRRQYHRRIAEVLAQRFPETAVTEPEILAHHYTEAQLIEPAIGFWRRAGERASQRSANLEAIAHLSKALELLKARPETPERDREELAITIALGPALMAAKGWSAPEVERAYLRAREIAQQAGDPAQNFTTTWGLWLVHQQAARLDEAQALAKEVLVLAREQNDEAFLLQAHHAAWNTSYRLAQFQASREHAEQGIALYDIEKHGSHAFTYGGHDPGVCGHVHASHGLWLLGYPDQALDQAQRAMKLAQELQHPFSLVHAFLYLAFVHHDRQEAASAYEHAEEAVALSAKHDFALLSAQAAVARGWAVAMDGRAEKGIAQIREGVLASRATGVSARGSYFLAILAEVCGRAGRVELGLNALDEALDLVQSTGERSWEPELHRLRGTLLIGPSVSKRTEAEAAFTRALEIARRQGAILPELRAAMGLARLRQSEGKTGAAYDLVTPIYDRFTEGFGTADLKDAKALLEELA